MSECTGDHEIRLDNLKVFDAGVRIWRVESKSRRILCVCCVEKLIQFSIRIHMVEKLKL